MSGEITPQERMFNQQLSSQEGMFNRVLSAQQGMNTQNNMMMGMGAVVSAGANITNSILASQAAQQNSNNQLQGWLAQISAQKSMFTEQQETARKISQDRVTENAQRMLMAQFAITQQHDVAISTINANLIERLDAHSTALDTVRTTTRLAMTQEQNRHTEAMRTLRNEAADIDARRAAANTIDPRSLLTGHSRAA